MCADRVEARVAPDFEHAKEQKPFTKWNDLVFQGMARRPQLTAAVKKKNIPAMRVAQTMTSTLATMFRAW